jgi:single-stranded DNA-binding protein
MRFGTTNYFLGIVKLTSSFQTYYTKEKKSRFIFCETRLAPAKQKSQKRKPLTKIRIYFLGALGNQAEKYYQKGDYVLVQGRLKLITRSRKPESLRGDSFPPKEYQLNVIKMSLVHRSETKKLDL